MAANNRPQRAVCHPEMRHTAFGLCEPCYRKQHTTKTGYRRTRAPYSTIINRTYSLRSKYGISPAEYDRLLLVQDGGCSICGTTEGLGVDHDHATGKVRGILCGIHNRGLGLFQDNPELLRMAALYLGDK